MSLTLPIEDLSRLKVSAQLSKTGQPVLSLTMKSSLSQENVVSRPSGIHVSFERVIENGCWSLAMTTSFEGTDHSSPSSVLGPTSFDNSVTEGISALGQTPAEWIASATPPAIGQLQGVELSMTNSLANVLTPSQSALDTSLGNSSFLGWMHPVDASSMQIDQDLAVAFTSSKPTQLPSQAFDSLFPLSPNSSPEPAGRSELLPSGSMSSRQEDDDSDSSSASHRSSDQRRVRRLPCLNASCKKKFMSEHTRQTHMKSHQHKPRRSFPCTMGCSEQFSRQHDRFRHEVTKHGYQSKWTCDKCHGFFSSEKSLNSHKCSSGGRWKIIPQ